MMSETAKQVKVAIIGSGLTGLTTAFYLKRAGINFVLIDQKDRVGGVIDSLNEDGFILEAGPNTGVLSHPEVAELFEDLNGSCQMQVAQTAVNRRLIWKGNRWHALPAGIIAGIATPLFSFYDKLRLLGEPFRKKGTNPDENLASLVKRRMGQSFLDYAVDPFILGIYSGDPEYLIPRYALPKLYNLEQTYGSFIGGAIKKGKEKKDDRAKKATRKIFSVQGGLSNLTNALAQNIGSENIILNAKSISINHSNGYEIISSDGKINIRSEMLITTVGSYEIPRMLNFISDKQKVTINNLDYAKVVQISLGFKNWKGLKLDAFGGLVPTKEKRNILGILFISAFLTDRAPKGGALLSVFVGGYRNPKIVDLTNEKLIELIEPDLKQMLGLNKIEHDLMQIFRYQHAIPQYGKNTGDRLAMINELEANYTGLILAGNLRDGIGMADRIKQGKLLADTIESKLDDKAKKDLN